MRPMLKAWRPCGRPQPATTSSTDLRRHVGVALEQRVDHEGARVVGAKRGERALEGAPDRGADCVDDHGFGHDLLPCSSGYVVLTGAARALRSLAEGCSSPLRRAARTPSSRKSRRTRSSCSRASSSMARPGKALEHAGAEQARARIVTGARGLRMEHLAVADRARGRAALQDEAVDRVEPVEEALRERCHRARQVAARRGLDHAHASVAANEPHRVARHAEPDLELRADRAEVDERLELLPQARPDHLAVVAAGVEVDAAADHDDRPGWVLRTLPLSVYGRGCSTGSG